MLLNANNLRPKSPAKEVSYEWLQHRISFLLLKFELCVKRVHRRPSLLWILAFISIYARRRLVLVYLSCFAPIRA